MSTRPNRDLAALPWSDVVATAGICAGLVLLGAAALNHHADLAAVLSFVGGVAGAAIGAKLATEGAISVARITVVERQKVQRLMLVDAVTALRQAVGTLSSVADSAAPGAVVVGSHLAVDQVAAALDDLKAVRIAAPVDDFATFQALRSFDDGTVLYRRMLDEVGSEASDGDVSVGDLRAHARNVASDMDGQIEKVLQALSRG